MSTSQLVLVYPKSVRVAGVDSYQNGHGTSTVIWKYLEGKYLPKLEFSRLTMAMFDEELLGEIWRLADDPRLTVAERLAMMVTFDWVYCPTELLKPVSVYLREFGDQLAADEPTLANHFVQMSHDYVTIADNHDRRLLGVGCDTNDTYDRDNVVQLTRPYITADELVKMEAQYVVGQ